VPLEEELLFVIGGAIGFGIAMRVAHHISGCRVKATFCSGHPHDEHCNACLFARRMTFANGLLL
jgi:hypothetical protein